MLNGLLCLHVLLWHRSKGQAFPSHVCDTSGFSPNSACYFQILVYFIVRCLTGIHVSLTNQFEQMEIVMFLVTLSRWHTLLIFSNGPINDDL
jgi:hypothetical protein